MDVFISYSHHDDDVANEIAALLDSVGISCFIDQRMDAGERFEDKIQNSLKFCKEVFALN